ncbi:MAG TPA: DUF4148 domain-containing protein [Burkholderiaceae bacterium]|nr:DUF4148 domain-containing protein [Burkholderiaceae bacterium]
MNVKQILIATAVVALAPIAAQANGGYTQRFGEAYPIATVETPSTLTRAEVRAEVLSLDRHGQNFGEAFPYQAKDPMTTRLLAEVRREARNAPRMYGEISGETGHN